MHPSFHGFWLTVAAIAFVALVVWINIHVRSLPPDDPDDDPNWW